MALAEDTRATLRDALRSLGACAPCVLRFLGVPSGDARAYREAAAADAAARADVDACCPCCLGVLQIDLDPAAPPPHSADPDPALDRAAGDASTSASTAAAAARPASASPPRRIVSHVSQFAAGMREGGHDITSFALEVTLPPALPARQAATRAHLAGVMSRVAPTSDCSASDDSSSGDGTAQDATTTTLPHIPQTVEIKDVFRALILPVLESRDARHDQAADFRFALLFEHDASATEAAEAYRDVAAADAANTRHKRKTPPAHLNVAVMPESPAGLWQSHGAAYNAAERRAERVRTNASTELRPKTEPPPSRPRDARVAC